MSCWCPTNSVKALKDVQHNKQIGKMFAENTKNKFLQNHHSLILFSVFYIKLTCSNIIYTSCLEFGTVQTAVMLRGWEGNCRSGVALAMRHRLSAIPTYWLNGLWPGRWAPTSSLYCGIFTFILNPPECVQFSVPSSSIPGYFYLFYLTCYSLDFHFT